MVVCSQSRAIKYQQSITLNSFTACLERFTRSSLHLSYRVHNSGCSNQQLRSFNFSYDLCTKSKANEISTIAVPAVYVCIFVLGSRFQLSDLAAARSTVEKTTRPDSATC